MKVTIYTDGENDYIKVSDLVKWLAENAQLVPEPCKLYTSKLIEELLTMK